MDTDLNEDQDALRRSARDFLEARVPTSVVRAMEGDDLGYDPGLWKELAALGWQGVMVPDSLGGSGLGFLEATVLAEEAGRALCPAPLLPTFVGTLAVLDAGTTAQQEAWLPPIAAGDAIWTPAFAESEGSWEVDDLELRIALDGDVVQLDGTKAYVQDAHIADWLLVFGRSDHGPLAVAVQRDAPGVSLNELRTIGSDRQFRVDFDGSRVPVAQIVDGPMGWISGLAGKAAVLECAYLAGLCRKDLELTVDHVTHREQFGRPLGSFQAVQHACANMLTDIDGAWLATYKAAWRVVVGEPEARLSAAIAKAWTSDASSRVVSMCQQLNGAMGFTSDYDAQLYFRRQKRAELFWGDTDFHRGHIAAILDEEG